jgi:3-phenylpropionate/trans-cinnamate dioxygenase ferredoxin reductase subunit
VSAAFRRLHEAAGIRILLDTTVAGLKPTADARSEVATTTGRSLVADLVVSSIGVIPNTHLASEAGLTVRNGIVVDEQLRTDDPAVSAIGDCASFPSPFSEEHVRLESVQNATDQARYLAGRLMGQPGRYEALPWFWSDQGGIKLQIAGLAGASDETAVRGDAESLSFSVYRFRAGHLVAVESVARPKDHMTARRLLATGVPVTREQVEDEEFDLKTLLPAPTPATVVQR